jgi:MFS family permease
MVQCLLRLHVAVFGYPRGALKGIIAAAYSLGAILSLPLIPVVNDKFGRRWSIFGGSVIMIIGALIQGFSTHGE